MGAGSLSLHPQLNYTIIVHRIFSYTARNGGWNAYYCFKCKKKNKRHKNVFEEQKKYTRLKQIVWFNWVYFDFSAGKVIGTHILQVNGKY